MDSHMFPIMKTSCFFIFFPLTQQPLLIRSLPAFQQLIPCVKIAIPMFVPGGHKLMRTKGNADLFFLQEVELQPLKVNNYTGNQTCN